MSQNIKLLKTIINTVLLGFFLSVISIVIYHFSNSEKPVNYLLIIILLAVIPAYTLLVKPLYYFLIKDKTLINNDLRCFLIEKGLNPKIKIVSIKTNNNAFTIGTMLFSKTILIEKTLINNLSNEDIEAIIYHQVGHIKKNHLFILYLSNLMLTLICYLVFFVKSNFIDIYIDNVFFEAVTVFITGMLIGCLFVYIPAKIKNSLDFRADLFASKKVGKVNYIRALNNLDNIVNDNISLSGYLGIKLLKRINNIKTNSYEV
ncbi:M48 family metalloprotease [Pontimicrobium sp. MEBiC01747]